MTPNSPDSSVPYARQSIAQADIDAVVDVLRSPFLTQGPAVEKFEQAIAQRVRASEAIAVANATSGLHLVCQALGVGHQDLIWTSPNSFVASANCARYCGANVDFVDIDPDTRNMSTDALREKLQVARRDGRLPKVLIVVHFGGLPCDLEPIAELAREHNIALVEDASHALGASYAGSPVGSGCHSDATIFSFHPVKIITSGEGGMIVTNRSDLAARLRLLRSHGITRNATLLTEPDAGAWYYEQLTLGYNYRLTDVAAALGSSQLERLDDFIERRSTIADRYARAFANRPDIKLPVVPTDRRSAWHLYPIEIPFELRRVVFDRLRADDILVNVHYIPIHLQPYYRQQGFSRGQFPNAERYYEGAISLPMYPDLTPAEQDFVVARVFAALPLAS